mgnify:CR=1 FL=1
MGESKKASDNNQTLRNVRVLIDILSQCTVYIAFAAFIILGVTHKTAEYIPYAFLVAVPVVVTYFIRKYVHPLFLFTIIHVAFVIGAVLLGRTEAEILYGGLWFTPLQLPMIIHTRQYLRKRSIQLLLPRKKN